MSNDLPAILNSGLPVGRELAEDIATAELLARSGFFNDITETSKAFAKIRAGRELGIGPVTALRVIHIIKGRVGLDYTLVAGLIRKSGRYDYRITDHTDTRACVEFYRVNSDGTRDLLGETEYTIEEARRAGLLNVKPEFSTWFKHPRNMLLSKAIGNGSKWHCPDVMLGGVATLDELVETTGYVSEPALPALPPPLDSGLRALYEEESALARSLGIAPLVLPENCTDAELIELGRALHTRVLEAQRVPSLTQGD